MSFDENLINNPSKGMPRLLEIMRALRDPEKGCPWDIEQNFKTIAPYTVEEAYEVADAIERENWEDLKNELGDLLLQTVYHTQIAEEENLFNFTDVINQISEKMIQRHPHVFGEENRNKSASQQIKDWESIKAKERAQKNQTGVLDLFSYLPDFKSVDFRFVKLTQLKWIHRLVAITGCNDLR